MKIYEVTFFPDDLQLQEKDIGNVYAILSILKSIYFGLNHRGLHLEYPEEKHVKENLKGKKITFKLTSGNANYTLNIEIIKSSIPTNLRFSIIENFERPKKLSENELQEIMKTYEILKDSFIYSDKIYLLSDNYEGQNHHYENRIFNPIECVKPLISGIESINFGSKLRIEDIKIKQYKNIDYIHGGELTSKVILKSRCESPSDFWLYHRGEEFYRKYYKSNFDILNYLFRQGDLMGSCLNMNEDEKENQINRLRQFRFELIPTSVMQMGTTGYTDEYFCETNMEYMILTFKNET